MDAYLVITGAVVLALLVILSAIFRDDEW